MTTKASSLFPLFALFFCALQSFSQGLYWESKISGSPGESERTDKAYYMPRMVKIIHGENGESAIIRLDKEMMIMVQPKDKTYWEMTFDKMEEMMKGASAQMDAQMAEMQKELEALPPEQRKMAEQMMDSHNMGKMPKVETTNTGETGTIGGYPCTKYVVKHDGQEFATVWATREIKRFDVMKKDMEEFGRRMQAIMPGGKDITGMMSGIDGFPIQLETKTGRKSLVTKIEDRSTAAPEFDPPSGYKKTDPPMMEKMKGG